MPLTDSHSSIPGMETFTLKIVAQGDSLGDECTLDMEADRVERLAVASSHFRMTMQGGFQEAADRAVRWEVQDPEERAILRTLVEDALAEPKDEKKRAAPSDPPPLLHALRMFLVANRFGFHASVQRFRNTIEVVAARSIEDAQLIMENISEEEYMDPEVETLLGRVCNNTFMGIESIQSFLTCEPRVYDSLSEVRVKEVVSIHPNILALPPLVMAAGIRDRGFGPGNVIYAMIRGYLEQSPHCEDMDDAQRTQLFKRMALNLAESNKTITKEFMALFVGSCPLALQTGVIPRLVSNLLPDKTYIAMAGLGITRLGKLSATLRLDELLPLESGQSKYYACGISEAFPLFFQVERHPRKAKAGDLFVFRLLALCPASRTGQRLCRQTIELPIQFRKVHVNGTCTFPPPQAAMALPGWNVQVYYEDPPPRKVGAVFWCEGQQDHGQHGRYGCIWGELNKKNKDWSKVVCHGSSIFPQGTLTIDIDMA